MANTKTLLSAEQFMEAANGLRAELVQGELIEMAPVGLSHGDAAVLLAAALLGFVRPRKLGRVCTEVGFVLSRNPDTVRAPDVAFISSERLKSLVRRDAFVEGAPELAVEVLSPTDRASDVLQKIREYLAAGARLVWVVDPHNRTVTAHHPSGDARTYSGAEPVGGEDVLPGFSFCASDLFEI